jgi:uncharacterized protein
MNAGRKRIVLAGGSGFIGSALAREWLRRDREVVVLTRHPKPRTDGVREVGWDGKNLGEWIQSLHGAEAVINLAGKNVNCPHTPENVRELTASRFDSVNAIASAIYHVALPPKAWVQASAIGYYGNPGDRICDEQSPGGDDVLATICEQWERAFGAAVTPKTRKVVQRIGFVLGRDGGALPVLERLTRWFLGGRAGSGRQYLSWIHVADLVQMFVAAVEGENASGVFNAVGPAPVMNKDFMRELRRTLHRPWSPPAPEFAIRIGARLMNSEPSLALAGCRAEPKRWREAGFEFKHHSLPAALHNLFS